MRFLIVEDQPSMAVLLKRYLQPLAQKVDIVHSWEEAMKATAIVDAYDIVTLDLNLGDSNAEKTIAGINDLRKHNSALVVIVVTGVMNLKDAERIFQAGADGFLAKENVSLHSSDFLRNMQEVAASIIANPKNYQRNVTFLEAMCMRIGKMLSDKPIT